MFFNTIEKDESLNDDKAVLTISKKGKPTKSHQAELASALHFEGAENPLKSSRVYSKEFLCEFNMASYPFDSQVCSVELIMKGNTGQ